MPVHNVVACDGRGLETLDYSGSESNKLPLLVVNGSCDWEALDY